VLERSKTPYPTAAKSLITLTAPIANSLARDGPSTTQSMLVIAHRSSLTGPATAKHAAVTRVLSTPESLNKSATTLSNVGWPCVP
jgi:hypothetical protein